MRILAEERTITLLVKSRVTSGVVKLQYPRYGFDKARCERDLVQVLGGITRSEAGVTSGQMEQGRLPT